LKVEWHRLIEALEKKSVLGESYISKNVQIPSISEKGCRRQKSGK
jgi:hypothetical protein